MRAAGIYLGQSHIKMFEYCDIFQDLHKTYVGHC